MAYIKHIDKFFTKFAGECTKFLTEVKQLTDVRIEDKTKDFYVSANTIKFFINCTNPVKEKNYCFNIYLIITHIIFHYLPFLETLIALLLNTEIK